VITVQIPSEGPLYLALWRFRHVDESLPKAAIRALEEKFIPRAPVPAAPLLSFVEVIDENS